VRNLAAGILPPVLRDLGLAAAVGELAAHSPVPVEVRAMPAQRLPASVEVAAYFVVSEALANVVKHAGARRAMVRVTRDDAHAVVEVADDGVGGAARDGSGLCGLADRVGALDGRLELSSPPGVGTLLRAEFPCAS
jgi:signal transduction histidine kinase